MKLGFKIFLVVALLLSAAGVQAQESEPTINGRWEGTVKLPERTLQVTVNVTGDGESRSGTIDIPGEGITGEAFDDLRYRHPRVFMEISAGFVNAVMRGKVKKGKMTGVVVQGSSTGTFELKPISGPAAQALSAN